MAPEAREVTMTLSDFFAAGNCVWLTLSVAWSLAYGIAVCIYYWPSYQPHLPDQGTFSRVWWWCYQLVFNILGAFIGWVMLYFLWHAKLSEFSAGHFIALAIAFLGITGNLPQIAMRLRGPDV
jgi:hypothetical protein